MVVIVPKFTGKVGISFCKMLKKENTFTAHFDKLGSLIWTKCDGNETVSDILDAVSKKFPDNKDIDQRLFLFLQQLRSLGYITY